MAAPVASSEAVRHAFAEEEDRGLLLAARVRLVAALAVGIWVWIDNDGAQNPGIWYFLAIVALLGVDEYAAVTLVRRGFGQLPLYLVPVVDVNLLAMAVFLPNPLAPDDYPVPMNLRFGDESFLFLFLAGYTLGYAPRRILWSGAVAIVSWSLWVVWVSSLPETRADIEIPGFEDLSMAAQLEALLDPQRVIVGVWFKQMVLLALITAGLALVVDRSRRLVLRHAAAERERTNLSRYFSPQLVDRLAQAEDRTGVTRQRHVAVLFADLEGFTRLASEAKPEEVILFLREYHRRMADAVFAHSGTLDEYLGDGVMATFGAMTDGLPDAGNALRCAERMRQEMAEWKAEPGTLFERVSRVRIGIHYGPVVLGNVGDRQLKFAVVGDTVNIASRLQEVGKTLQASLVVSAAAVEQARRENAPTRLIDSLTGPETRSIRGRAAPVEIWFS